MATAEALMELVPSGHSKRNSSQVNISALEHEEENSKERAMAATYAAYTKRTKLHAEKAKAQQLSRQLKTRLQFARLKVDYGWTRQSLNEVENLYFHLSRARPIPQAPKMRADEQEDQVEGIGDSPVLAAPVQAPSETPIELSSTQSTQEEIPLSTVLHTQSLPGQSTSPVSLLFRTPSLPQPSPAPAPKRPEYVERTRTGGIVRNSHPSERLRTGGKVKSASGALSPKKRGRPRMPDGSESAAPTLGVSVSGTSGTASEGSLTYDSFWSSLGSLKTPAGS